MQITPVELRILHLLSQPEVRGTASLGQEAIPSDRPSRTAQGAALAVGRFIRSLSTKGLISWYVAENDRLSTYCITPLGRDAYKAASIAS